jgi:hypothetical protein
MFGAFNIPHTEMRVQVTVAVQDPEQVDCDALAKTLPRGRAEVKAVFGGLNVTNPDRGEITVIAQAAGEAFMPLQA